MRTMRLLIMAVAIQTPFNAAPAWAEGVNIGDACPAAGAMQRKDDANGGYELVCDGAHWQLSITHEKTGNIGIGTTTPGNKLQVEDASTPVLFSNQTLNDANTNTIGVLDLSRYGHSGTTYESVVNLMVGRYENVGDNARTRLDINLRHTSEVPGTNVMTLLSSGNVGIGTTAPSTILNVDPQGAGTVLIGNPNTGAGGYTSLSLGISAQSGGYSTIQSTKASGTLYGDLALNPNGGNVGIGTTAPTAQLDVYSSFGAGFDQFRVENAHSTDFVVNQYGRVGIGTDPNDGAFEVYNDDAGWVGVLVSSNAGDSDGLYVTMATNSDSNYGLYVDDPGTNDLVFTGSGKLGIGTATPSVALDIVGDINYTGLITDVSDRRMKDNIRPLEAGQLEKITGLQGVSFTMKGSEQTELGLIAQDVEPLYPDLVKTTLNGTKSMNYMGLIGPLVEAIKEQQREIEDLRAENRSIAERLAIPEFPVSQPPAPQPVRVYNQ